MTALSWVVSVDTVGVHAGAGFHNQPSRAVLGLLPSDRKYPATPVHVGLKQ